MVEDLATHRKCSPAWGPWSEASWAGSRGHFWGGLRAPSTERLTDAMIKEYIAEQEVGPVEDDRRFRIGDRPNQPYSRR